MNIDLLDAALGNAERLYASLFSFRKLVAEISDFQEEAARAKAEAAAAQKSLADLQAQVMAAQSELDKLQSKREAAKQQLSELAAEHSQLSGDVNRIRALFKGAA
jgi:chromosome segregation ATPase